MVLEGRRTARAVLTRARPWRFKLGRLAACRLQGRAGGRLCEALHTPWTSCRAIRKTPMEQIMRMSVISRAHGHEIPRGPGPSSRGASSIRVPRARRDSPKPRPTQQRVEYGRKHAGANGLDAATRPAVAPPVTKSDSNTPSRDRSGPVDVLRIAEHAISSIRSGATSGFQAAWIIVGVLLLVLALISAVSYPPRVISEDDLARASVRVPHERADPGRF